MCDRPLGSVAVPPIRLPMVEELAVRARTRAGGPAPAATDRDDALLPKDLPTAAVDALYVHVPFCFHKCHYCDFYSITHQGPERMTKFVDLMLREADLWTRAEGSTVMPLTVFFGGGTPSLLPVAEMRRLIEGLRERIDCSAVEEWTVEAN